MRSRSPAHDWVQRCMTCRPPRGSAPTPRASSPRSTDRGRSLDDLLAAETDEGSARGLKRSLCYGDAALALPAGRDPRRRWPSGRSRARSPSLRALLEVGLYQLHVGRRRGARGRVGDRECARALGLPDGVRLRECGAAPLPARARGGARTRSTATSRSAPRIRAGSSTRCERDWPDVLEADARGEQRATRRCGCG